jgi:hypothetical protein
MSSGNFKKTSAGQDRPSGSSECDDALDLDADSLHSAIVRY